MITPHFNNETKPHWHEPMQVYPSSNAFKVKDHIIVEVGPGRGDYLFRLAKENSSAMVYGIELRDKRFKKLVKRRDQRSLNNVTLVKSDAREAVKELFNNHSVDSIHILFPDPWPKRRHGHLRLMNEGFIRDCLNVLKDSGELNFITDDADYAQKTALLFRQFDNFKPQYNPAISTSAEDAFETFFAKKWRLQGRTIYYQRYIKENWPSLGS